MSLVSAKGVCFRYPHRGAIFKAASGPWALEEVTIDVEEGATLGVVGESGSGKSTLVRILCGLLAANAGSIEFSSKRIEEWLQKDPAQFRRRSQIVFQDPASSFDPRMRLRRSLEEPIRSVEGRVPTIEELARFLGEVGLSDDVLAAFPHQLSGGQLQRLAIARSLSVGPDVIYADEPTSALDVSIQAQVLNLMLGLRHRLGLTLVIVSHDMAVVSQTCEWLVVMKEGRVVEQGPTVQLIEGPRSEYTRRLIEAARAISLDRLPGREPVSNG